MVNEPSGIRTSIDLRLLWRAPMISNALGSTIVLRDCFFAGRFFVALFFVGRLVRVAGVLVAKPGRRFDGILAPLLIDGVADLRSSGTLIGF